MPERIEGKELASIRGYFEHAANIARDATCYRAKCGSVIISKSGDVIGTGFNAPPLGDESQRTCETEWNLAIKPKYDKTCCIHAEWNAVIAMLKEPRDDQVAGSRLYFMRISEDENFTDAGLPYCTTCSRFVMQSGVAEFALWNDDGADIYKISEYNELSYRYHER